MILALTGAPLIIVSVIAFILIIGIIITVHELGHFIFAKRCGILCHDFSIGFGPVIYHHQFGETSFNIRAIPIGGFVSMADGTLNELIKPDMEIGINLNDEKEIKEIILDDNKECDIRGKVIDVDLFGKDNNELHITLEDNVGEKYYTVTNDAYFVFEKNERMQITPYDRCFDSKSKWDRFLTLFAGPMMNMILAIIIALIVAFSTGCPNYDSNVLGKTTEGEPAYNVLMPGDKILKINDKQVSTWYDVQTILYDGYDNYELSFKFQIERNSQIIEYDLDSVIGFNYFGITNFNVDNITLSLIPGTEVKGLEIGTPNPHYKNDNEVKNSLSKNDYIVGVSINNIEYNLNENVEVTINGQAKTLTGWAYLAYLTDNYVGKGSPDVRFKYYHKTEDKNYVLVDYSDARIISPYTDELLTSQNITPVLHYVGISPVYHFDFIGSIKDAFSRFWNDFSMIFKTLKILLFPSDVRQVDASNLSSVVGIFGMVKNYVGAGILPLLAFMCMLSVNIGIVNLLPIPALDGGRILFLIIEAITRKKVSKKVENTINLVFFVLLMILLVYVTYNDVLRLIK